MVDPRTASRIMMTIAALVMKEFIPEKIVTPPIIARAKQVMLDCTILIARTVSKRKDTTLIM